MSITLLVRSSGSNFKMIAKIIILCAALAAVHATALLHGAVLHTGHSVSTRKQDGHGNYAFAYDIVDGKGATNSRSEVGDAAGNKKGAYSLTDIDGRARRVDYVADGLGFRAAVKTNEPGTAASAPASALIVSPYAAPVAPAPIAVAHAAAPIALAAPIAHIGAPSAYFASIVHGGGWGLGINHHGLNHYGINHLGLGLNKGLIW